MSIHNKDKMAQVTFLPEGIRGTVVVGNKVDKAAQELGADLQSVCGGHGKCGKCRLRYSKSNAAGKSSLNLSEITQIEKDIFSDRELKEGWRLACQCRLLGDVIFEVPKESRSGRQIIRKEPGSKYVKPVPSIYVQAIINTSAELKNPLSDWKRLLNQISAGKDNKNIYPDIEMLKQLPVAFDNNKKISAIIRKDCECIGFIKSDGLPLTGVSLDIGTTTMAIYLCNLETGKVLTTASEVNPQISYGEDVISRITYAAGGIERRIELQKSLVYTVNKMIGDVCSKVGIDRDTVADMTCVGNTCMHHLFLGFDPSGLGSAPFAPIVTCGLDIKARDIGINIAPGAWVHALPGVSSFIGADTVGVMLSVETGQENEVILIIDVGTNGEIVLVAGEKQVCASCATGPALEGASLSCGMRAAEGAVERVWIDSESLAVETSIIGSAQNKKVLASGICGSGVIDAVKAMLEAGIIKKNGNFDKQCPSSRLKRQGNDTAFVLVSARESAGGRDIEISQDDIRAVQMAKGAIQAATRLLMAETGVVAVDRVVLAGAFGSVIDPVSAMVIGLIPEIPHEKVTSVGNAAGDGARMALISEKERLRAAYLARKLKNIELTTHPDFQREFAMAMHFPHM